MSDEGVGAGCKCNPDSARAGSEGLNPLLLFGDNKPSLVVRVINRSMIESNDVDAMVAALDAMTIPDGKSLFRRMDWSISGYDDDSRELFQIPEVVAFLRQLDERWPYWGFYQHPCGRWVRTMTFCLAGTHFTSGSRIEWDQPSVVCAYIRWSIALAKLCRRHGIGDETMIAADQSLVRQMDLGRPIRLGEEA